MGRRHSSFGPPPAQLASRPWPSEAPSPRGPRSCDQSVGAAGAPVPKSHAGTAAVSHAAMASEARRVVRETCVVGTDFPPPRDRTDRSCGGCERPGTLVVRRRGGLVLAVAWAGMRLPARRTRGQAVLGLLAAAALVGCDAEPFA